MGSGKHSSDSEKQFKISPLKKIKDAISFINILVVITILVVIVGSVFITKKLIEMNKNKQPKVEEPVSSVVTEMPEQVEGYDILGKIVIDKIQVEQYILDSYESKALENGVGKLYGENLNDYGNFCIVGHNYENIFQKLSELDIGDTFKILDREFNETEYEIREIYSVEPDDLTCLLPNNDLIQLTLITCENGATTRLVARCEKVEEISEENLSSEGNEQ